MTVDNRWQKDTNANLDWQWDWSDWLAVGETIQSQVTTVPVGLTKGTNTASSTTVTVWLSGGTSGTIYDVSCRITTTAGRVDERTIHITVTDR